MYSGTHVSSLHKLVMAYWGAITLMSSIPPSFVTRWSVMSQGSFIIIGCGVFQTPHPPVLDVSEDAGAGTTFVGLEEALKEYLFRTITIGLHAIGRLVVG